MSLIPLIGALALVSSLPVLWWAVSGAATASPAATRNLSARPATYLDYREAFLARSAHERSVGPLIERVARRARRLTPNGMLDNLERRVLLAGAPDAWPMEKVLTAKLVGGAVVGALGVLWFLGAPSLTRGVLLLAGTVFGFFLPDILLYNAAEKRQQTIQRALPDTLDQMTISVEAGLAFEAAIVRAGRSGDGPLNDELTRTMQDVQAGMARSAALKNLLARTEVEDLRHFVLAILQAESYGVPVSRVLRVQAAEMRLKRRQRAEEAAMKLPVKILFPMIVFILPTLFIVLLGPAAIRILEMLS